MTPAALITCHACRFFGRCGISANPATCLYCERQAPAIIEED